jgi:hypothetical protein
MKNTIDRAELPEHGERVDLTLLTVGFKNLKDEDRENILVLKCQIDNGPYKGKVVTGTIKKWETEKVKMLERATGISMNRCAPTPTEYIAPLYLKCPDVRLSAQFTAEEKEGKRRRTLHTNLSFFDKPAQPRSLNKIKTDGSQWQQ